MQVRSQMCMQVPAHRAYQVLGVLKCQASMVKLLDDWQSDLSCFGDLAADSAS